MPPNPTLGLPGPRQIVELQTRREYELFGLVPSSIAELHQAALQRAYANPQVVGVWAWNSTGGWGGGKATLGTTGWNLWTELGSALTGALAQQPGCDAEAFVRAWLAQRWPDTPFAGAVADLYLASAALIEQGWYTGICQCKCAPWRDSSVAAAVGLVDASNGSVTDLGLPERCNW